MVSIAKFGTAYIQFSRTSSKFLDTASSNNTCHVICFSPGCSIKLSSQSIIIIKFYKNKFEEYLNNFS
ncbi:MAG: hypothetical protein ACOZBL_04370 [Patescibacteria group bacterium]